MIGETIGSYTILRRLGEGGMGEVYLAEHRHIARRAAIKLLLPEFTAKADVVSRFFTEARATSLIRHPGIVEIIDCAVHTNGRAYIIMEYLEGESLASTIERTGNLAGQPKSALAILGQIASALGAAHSKGIIHRDLKPDNIFLAAPSGEGGLRVKILDFGIAKLAAEGQAALQKTRTGSLLGTPIYMSPEQCRGAGAVDHRTDIYSLGCIAFELFAGRPPFVREGAGELLVAHMSESPQRLRELARSVTPELEDLVGRMLAKDPAQRPASTAEVIQSIEGLLRTRSAEFATLIQPPSGFPSSRETSPARLAVSADGVSGENPVPPSGTVITGGGQERMVGSGAVVAEPVIGGGTRLLAVVEEPPLATSRGPKSQTMFSRTASESLITHNTRRAPRRGLVWGAAAVALLAVGAIVLWPKSKGPETKLVTKPDEVAVQENKQEKKQEGQPARQESQEAPKGTTVPDNAATPTPDPLPAVFELSSDPPGAEVWMPGEGTPRGVTPLKLAIPKGDGPRKLIVKAKGFHDQEVSLEPGYEGPLSVTLAAVKEVDKPARLSRPVLGKGELGKGEQAKSEKGTGEQLLGKGGHRQRKKDDSPYKPMGD